MRLQEISDEFRKTTFADKDNKLYQLFRIQKARCHEFMLFYDRLTNNYEYTHLNNFINPDDLPYFHSTNINIERCFPFPPQISLPPNKKRYMFKEMYKNKYKRMLKAKHAFEEMGGLYKNYRNEDD